MTQGTLFEQIDRTPLTYLVLIAYLTLAFLTDPLDPNFAQLVEYGACSGLLVQDGDFWRLLSGAFLHGGLIHLLFNAYCLVMVGPALEASLGSVRFGLLYVVAAVGGNVVALLWMDDLRGIVVGGSGALFGMFGAIVAMNMRGGRHLLEFLQFRGPRSIVMLIAINLVIGLLVPVISNSAHVGGLVAGFVLVFSFFDRGRHGKPDAISRAIQAGWLALFVSLGAYCLKPIGHVSYHALRIGIARMSESQWESLAEGWPARYREAFERWR